MQGATGSGGRSGNANATPAEHLDGVQHVVIVEIFFIAQRQSVHPLSHQGLYAVLNAAGIAVVWRSGTDAG